MIIINDMSSLFLLIIPLVIATSGIIIGWNRNSVNIVYLSIAIALTMIFTMMALIGFEVISTESSAELKQLEMLK